MGERGRESLGQWDSLSEEALTRNSTWLLGNRIALLNIGASGMWGREGGSSIYCVLSQFYRKVCAVGQNSSERKQGK